MAAVAIPKLAATRDDASATTCVHEIGQFVSELSAQYTKLGNTKFTKRDLDRLTNAQKAVTSGNGFKDDATKTPADGFNYVCDGVDTMTFTWAADKSELTVAPVAAYNPQTATVDPATIAEIVTNKLAGSTINADGSAKVYKF
ncbi:hypothetical protein MNB_SV-15-581 [hydrothermal vent metagenome]|uniref:Uncharacterized protein n=1 Tax=hydrothermal vent metagenome TaxID=652676 RepID=A0A1W1EJA1_9ZZZZ